MRGLNKHMHKLVENIVTDSELEYLKQIFLSHDHIFSHGMDKVLLPFDEIEFNEFATNLIERKLNINEPYKIVGDNFYKHSHSYFPHCDAIEDKAWLNIVIPIQRFEPREDQKFIVFDQRWQGKNITWLGNFEIDGDFYSNKKTNSRPCDGEFFQGGTNTELPQEIWQHIDSQHFERDYFYSMSGTAYSWTPGSAIVFDSQHIHSTGRMMSKSKLGVSIRIAHK
jgi:hypothetical protein